jgi:hypothetical protein
MLVGHDWSSVAKQASLLRGCLAVLLMPTATRKKRRKNARGV